MPEQVICRRFHVGLDNFSAPSGMVETPRLQAKLVMAKWAKPMSLNS